MATNSVYSQEIKSLSFQVISHNPLDGDFLKHILASEELFHYKGQFFSWKDFLDAPLKAQILFFDLDAYSRKKDVSCLKYIRKELPETTVIVYSTLLSSSILHYVMSHYNIFACLTRPLRKQEIHRIAKEVIQHQSLLFSLRPDKEAAPVSFKNHVESIQSASEEDFQELAFALSKEIQKAAGSNGMSLTGCTSQYLEYFDHIFRNSPYGDAQHVICTQYKKDASSLDSEEGLDNLLLRFVRDINRTVHHSQQTLNYKRIDRVKELVRSKLEKGMPISLEGIARETFISPYYLSRSFKKIEGTTFVDYLQTARLDYAKFLLATTDASVEDIAFQCGYGEVNSFRRLFRKRLSMSPSAFRQSLLKNIP